MTEGQKSPEPVAAGSEANFKKHFTGNEIPPERSTQQPESQDEQELRGALLARLRLELVLSKIDALAIERLGAALKTGCISVRQCLAIQANPTAFHDMEGSS